MDATKLLDTMTDTLVGLYEAGEDIGPIALAQRLMALPDNIIHNATHHYLVPAVLLYSWGRATGTDPETFKSLLAAARTRSMQIPGGACGNMGCCGAAVGSGIFFSLIRKANPKLSRGWDDANRATATALMHMADVGGPRCCKRCSFLAIETAAALLKSADGIDMCEASPLCTWFPDNRECLETACPYYPK